MFELLEPKPADKKNFELYLKNEILVWQNLYGCKIKDININTDENDKLKSLEIL